LHPHITSTIGHTKNDAFLLRSYLAFRTKTGTNELSITVDVLKAANSMLVSADACMDNGDIVAAGPESTFLVTRLQAIDSLEFDNWFSEFNEFLRRNQHEIALGLSRLK
jgi:hypothetical protein